MSETEQRERRRTYTPYTRRTSKRKRKREAKQKSSKEAYRRRILIGERFKVNNDLDFGIVRSLSRKKFTAFYFMVAVAIRPELYPGIFIYYLLSHVTLYVIRPISDRYPFENGNVRTNTYIPITKGSLFI